MSYETRKDEMIGTHVAQFQNELSLAKSLEACERAPVMPYGYPVRLYHPYHIVKSPRYTPMCHHQHDRLSNNVPWVLGMELVDNNVIGVYNPKR